IKQNEDEDIDIQEEFLKIIKKEEIVDQFEEDEEDQIANQVATNIIKDFNSNLTAEAKEDIQQEKSQQKEIQQKEIIEIDDSSKTMSVEFNNLLQRSSGLSGVFDNIALKSSTSMSISKLSEEKIIEEEIESQTELEKDNIESQTELEKDDNNSSISKTQQKKTNKGKYKKIVESENNDSDIDNNDDDDDNTTSESEQSEQSEQSDKEDL
ncbi:18844_t:CDS:2, partial [Dentiscutata erythropus]